MDTSLNYLLEKIFYRKIDKRVTIEVILVFSGTDKENSKVKKGNKNAQV